MHRAWWLRSWKRLFVQAGLLVGLSLTFVGPRPARLGAAPLSCEPEGECMLKKPLLLFVLDYSTSMNEHLECPVTRWDAATAAIVDAVTHDNGSLASRHILGLMRFGHDPDPQGFNTPIPGDTSGLHDGFKLDVGFYDPDLPGKPYFECDQGDAIVQALDAIPPPLGGDLVGIESWTRGALQRARATFNLTHADHPDDADRLASIVLITDGPWTDQQGSQQLAPAGENPATVAGALFDQDGVPIHVITLGEAAGHPFADELAAMGGTGQPLAAATPFGLTLATRDATDHASEQLTPVCAPELPRVMILLDASSSMLNLQGGLVRAPMGQGGWELARQTLAGDPSVFEIDIANGKVAQLALFGLSVFGSETPDESKLSIQYGPCPKQNFAWALDPTSSCGPGCVDPWADAPIPWTFQDGSQVQPFFAEPTISHMPTCLAGATPNKGCFGSGTFTHTGLLTVQANLAAYAAACADPLAPFPCAADTPFLNILITDGATNSTSAEYTPPLVAMFDQGVTTHVIGFGDGVDSPQAIATLEDMADKGSGNQLDYHDADNQADLELALATILESSLPAISACCMLTCGAPQPWLNPEPDPLPPDSFGCSEADPSTSSTTTGETTLDTATTRPLTSSTSTGAPSTDATSTTSGDPPDPDSDVSMSITLTADGPEPEPTTSTATPTGDPPATTRPPEPGSSDDTSDPPQTADPGCGCRSERPDAGLLALLALGWRSRRRRHPTA